MVTQRSASLNGEQGKGRSDEPCPDSSDPNPWACGHETCFASQPGVTCTHSYLLYCMGVASCPSGGLGQTAVPGFGWASQGLKGASSIQGHRPQETHTVGHLFLQHLTKLSFCLSSETLQPPVLYESHRDPWTWVTWVPGGASTAVIMA